MKQIGRKNLQFVISVIIWVALFIWMMTTPVRAAAPDPPGWFQARLLACAYDGWRGVEFTFPPSDGADAFIVYRDGGAFTSTLLQHAGLGVQTIIRRNLPQEWIGDTFTFHVTALNPADEESGPSPSVVLTIAECGPGVDQPQIVGAAWNGSDAVALVWVPPTSPIFPIWGYRVNRVTDAELWRMYVEPPTKTRFLAWVLWDVTGTVPNFFVDSPLTVPYASYWWQEPIHCGETYHYSVEAINMIGRQSPMSDIVSVEIPPCP